MIDIFLGEGDGDRVPSLAIQPDAQSAGALLKRAFAAY